MNENSTPVPNNSQPPESFQSFSQAPSPGERQENEDSPMTLDSGPTTRDPRLMTRDFARRIGGQPGNHNARKHGLYAKYLSPKQRQDYNEARGVRGVEAELALFRCKLAEMLETEPWNWILLNRIANTILRLEAALPEETPEAKLGSKSTRIMGSFFSVALEAGDERVTEAFDAWMEKNHPVGFVPENESHVQPEADST